MPDERLRLIAELKDQVTGQLKRIQAGFRNFDAANKHLPDGFKKFQSSVFDAEKRLGSFGKRSHGMSREFEALQKAIGRVNPAVGDLTESVGEFVGRGG